MRKMVNTGVRSADFIILIVLAGLIVLLLATMAVHRKHTAGKPGKDGKRNRSGLPQLLPPGLRLSAVEEQILSRLGWLFRNPGQQQRLLTDQQLFLRAARRALREGLATERELLGLARRAGFNIDRIDPKSMSTLKLPSGVEVSVADSTMKSGAGSIVQNHPDALRLRLKLGHTTFAPGTRLDVVCNSSRGLYRFSSVVTGRRGKILDVQHTDQIESVQRRTHQRHGVQVAVELRPERGEPIATRTADLSIGGAATKKSRPGVYHGKPASRRNWKRWPAVFRSRNGCPHVPRRSHSPFTV